MLHALLMILKAFNYVFSQIRCKLKWLTRSSEHRPIVTNAETLVKKRA